MDRELAVCAQRLRAVVRVVQQLAAEYPRYQDTLLRIVELVDTHDE